MRVTYSTEYSSASLCVTKQPPTITTFYLKQIETGRSGTSILCGMVRVINKCVIYKTHVINDQDGEWCSKTRHYIRESRHEVKCFIPVNMFNVAFKQ